MKVMKRFTNNDKTKASYAPYNGRRYYTFMHGNIRNLDRVVTFDIS
jgi:hypothetical protein